MFPYRQRIFLTCLCLSLGILGDADLRGQQINQQIPTFQNQQIIQTPSTFQSQNNLPTYPQYPNGTVNGQGVIVNGQIVNGQIINGQIINGQPMQGTVINPPIVNGGTIIGTTPTPAVRPNNDQKVELEKAKENIRTMLKKYREVVADNDEFKINFKNLSLENEQLKGRVGVLTSEGQAVAAELAELRNKPAPMESSDDSVSQLEGEVDQLKNMNQGLLEQTKNLSDKVTQLFNENTELKSEIENARMADPDATDTAKLQAALDAKVGELESANTQYNRLSSQLTKLQQDNQQLQDEATRLSTLQQEALAENDGLNEKISLLSTEKSGFQDQVASFQAAANKPALVKPSSNLNSKIATLTRENRSLKNANSRYMEENESLNKSLAKLESSNKSLNATNVGLQADSDELSKTAGMVSDTASSAIVSPVPSVIAETASSKWSINRWILPFLLTGLAIALFVVLTEEYRGGQTQVAAGKVVDSGRTSDGHRGNRNRNRGK